MVSLSVFLILLLSKVNANCIEDESINSHFASLSNSDTIPLDGSCCQYDVCGISCPQITPPPSNGYGIALALAIFVFCIIGIVCYFCIDGKAENFFVAGRNLPLIITTLTLASQSIDSNALLGNIDFSYKYHFWDGCVLPLGLGLSLIINALVLARHINAANVLTLPDIYAIYYGRLVEILVSIISCCSFLALLAGNLVGMSVIMEYVYDVDQSVAVFVAGIIIILYTITGGLFSVAYTDVVQALISVIGCIVFVIYMFSSVMFTAPPASIGFTDYIYPDTIGDDGVCDNYQGISCTFDANACCYNPDNDYSDNGAFPIGDSQASHNTQMTDAWSLSPFPNAVIFNWATIFVLAFGNLGALDFQARNMAARNGTHATLANIIAGCLTLIVGIPFAYLGSMTRVYYGPDSAYAQFEADTCSKILDLPQCAMWLPDPNAFVKLLTHDVPPFLGGWCMIVIVSASMSTCDGAILAISTVVTRNIFGIQEDTKEAEHIPYSMSLRMKHMSYFERLMAFFRKDLLRTARLMVIPFTFISCLIATFFKSSHSLGATGYLLIVAFDIMLAGNIVPLVAAFYTDPKYISSSAALAAVIGGCLVRLILEFSLPKDGYLLFPFDGDEYLNYGSVSSTKRPGFLDVDPSEIWDPQTCEQERYRDYTGIDSLISPVVSLILYVSVHWINRCTGCCEKIDSYSWMQSAVEKNVETKRNEKEFNEESLSNKYKVNETPVVKVLELINRISSNKRKQALATANQVEPEVDFVAIENMSDHEQNTSIAGQTQSRNPLDLIQQLSDKRRKKTESENEIQLVSN